MKGVGGSISMRSTVPSSESPPRMLGDEWSMLGSTARIVSARLRMAATRQRGCAGEAHREGAGGARAEQGGGAQLAASSLAEES